MRTPRLLLLIWPIAYLAAQESPAPPQFATLCSGCHGDKATGTERGTALVENRRLRSRSVQQIAELIRTGTPNGMPPFALPKEQLDSLATWVHSLNASAYDVKPAGDAAAGERFFFGKGQCGSCHMVAGKGGSNGPDLSGIGRQLTLRQLSQSLVDPVARVANRSTSSCPGWAWCPDDAWVVVNVRMKNGLTLRGFARNQGKHDIQLQTLDGKMRLLKDTEYTEVKREPQSLMPPLKATDLEGRDLLAYMSKLGGITVGKLAAGAPVPEDVKKQILEPRPGEWPTYNGDVSANRHSKLDQINLQNASKLQLAWSYSLPYSGLEMTPLVVDGVMYVTGPNQVCAIDSQTGRQIWCYSRPRTPAGRIAGDAAKGANRGAAVLGDRVFFATDDAHLICLNRLTGGLMWEVFMPEEPSRYGSTVAPLVVGDLVIGGVAGGDEGIRGFIAAYKATTGELAWRYWTVPKRGEPGSETWIGNAIDVGGGATWLTGSYDPETQLLYWPTGNPFPDTDGDDRKGDNLYTNSVVALDIHTGKLRWYFQFTPHDLHDWDATEPLVLVNAKFGGRDRKLLLQANRNGYYYVLDRTTGEFLLGKPFVKRLTWASGIDAKGRPQLLEGAKPTKAGTVSCPAVRGATNWYSTAYNPSTRLFYVMAVEDCNIYQQSKLGGYVPFRDPKNPPEKYLRALDVETGKIVWEIPQVGPPESNYSGVLSTAGGLVFYGETGGGFAAVDAKTGKTLWHFETNEAWKASPMTYTMNGRQYVAIASGSSILSFALKE
ncbi:MAG TPA: PQQ-binding-like beta-propeller repeat protein [Bryobacteraceae bacterium]|nr:PQQ-binding-like beta-propeller repeat protein [Bryobacteraceae bacterium]